MLSVKEKRCKSEGVPTCYVATHISWHVDSM